MCRSGPGLGAACRNRTDDLLYEITRRAPHASTTALSPAETRLTKDCTTASGLQQLPAPPGWVRAESSTRSARSSLAVGRPVPACGSCATSMPPWPIPPGCSHIAWVPSNVSAGSSRTGTPPGPGWLTPRLGWSLFSTTWSSPSWPARLRASPRSGPPRSSPETGDLHRFTSSRAVVKHAGLAPRQRLSGTFAGRARLSGAGRPHLRAAAWRAVWERAIAPGVQASGVGLG